MKKVTTKGQVIEIVKGDIRNTYTATCGGQIIEENKATVGAAVKGHPEIVAILGAKVALTRPEYNELMTMWHDAAHDAEMKEIEDHLAGVRRAMATE